MSNVLHEFRVRRVCTSQLKVHQMKELHALVVGAEIDASMSPRHQLHEMQGPIFEDLRLARDGAFAELLCKCRWRVAIKKRLAA